MQVYRGVKSGMNKPDFIPALFWFHTLFFAFTGTAPIAGDDGGRTCSPTTPPCRFIARHSSRRLIDARETSADCLYASPSPPLRAEERYGGADVGGFAHVHEVV